MTIAFFDKALRLGTQTLAFVMFLTTLSPSPAHAGPNSLNSSLIPDEFLSRYSVTPSCGNCHGSISGERPNDPGGDGTSYGRALDVNMNYMLDGGGVSIPNATILRNGFDAVEVDYAPHIATVNGTAFAGGAVVLPGDQNSLTITLDTGRNFSGMPGSLIALNPTGGLASLVPTTVSSLVNLSLSTLPLSDRGARRRSATPYTLDLAPVNSTGFRNFAMANVTRNQLQITFQNIAPVGATDSYLAAQGNDASNKLALPVLSNDSDADGPDSDMTVTLVSGLTGTDPGTIEVNGAGNGFLYTVPATLPLVATQTSFQYAPVDGEALAGTAVTVNITIPAGVPPANPPIAQDDSFTFDEDTVLAGDVKTDNGNGPDSDPEGLGTVAFSVLTPPARGSLSFAANGTFSYTPAAHDNGTLTFDYLANDGTGTDTATVTLNITPVNDAPTATSIALAPRTEAEADFAANLLDPAFVLDVDGDPLSVSDVVVTITLNETDNVPVAFVKSDTYTVSGSQITFSPTALSDLDDDETADISVSYNILDGTAPAIPNTLTLEIRGLDNGLGRLAGLYADSISSRYNGHFGGINQANGSCHTCHLPGRVSADVDTVDECNQSPPVFNTYGLNLCLNRDANVPALADLERRMAEAEPEFAPRLSPSPRFTIDDTAAAGDSIGVPLTVASNGKTVDGNTSDIVEYLIVAAGRISANDASGQFTVDNSGQMRVASGATLMPGTYSFVVLPVNDAGQKDNDGNIRDGIPGFFPFEVANQTSFTVEVAGVLPQAVADSATTLIDTPVDIAVTSNDLGGAATSLSVTSAPANGTAEVNTNLTVTYTPAAGFSGTDSFTYTAMNSSGSSAPVIVTVTVLPAGSVVARDDSTVTISGAPVIIDVLANDPGALTSGSTLTIVAIVSAPDPSTVGSLILSGQSLVFTSVAGFTGEVVATYSAANPGRAPVQASVTITVLPSGGNVISETLVDPELKKVARSFEQSCALTGDAEFLAACVNLTAAATQGEDLAPAMRALRNEEHLATVDTTYMLARNFGRGLQKRIRSLRSGRVRGFDMSGLTLSIGNESVPTQLLSDLVSGALGISPKDRLEDTSLGFFVSGDISFSEKDGSNNASGFDTTAGNMLIGMDYEIDPRLSVGVSLGYTTAETDFSGGGSLDTRAVQASVYGRVDDALLKGIDFDGYLSFGLLKFASDRRILFTANSVTVDSMAEAKFEGRYLNFVPTLSFSEQLGRYGDPLGDPATGVELRWHAGLDYLRLNVDGYTEGGGAGLGLTTQPETYQSLHLFAGVDARRPIWISPRVPSEIRGGITFRTELLDETRSVTSFFTAAGSGAPSFTVTEPGANGFAGNLNLGITLGLDPGELSFDYTHDFTGNGFRTQALSVGYAQSIGRRGQLQMGVQRSFTGGNNGSLDAEAKYSLRF